MNSTIVFEKKKTRNLKTKAYPLSPLFDDFLFFFKRYLLALKMTLTVQFSLVTVLLYACFCSASKVTGPETPLEQSDSHNTKVSGARRLHLLGSLADSRMSLARVLRLV